MPADAPTIPAPPSPPLSFHILRFARNLWVAFVVVVARPGCSECGKRDAYSWTGDIWPRAWLCQSCTWDPELSEERWRGYSH